MKKYVCDTLCFVGGRRIRPGEVFELPERVAPAAGMRPAETAPKATGQKNKSPRTFADIAKADSDSVR
jgi:hypothetical protein